MQSNNRNFYLFLAIFITIACYIYSWKFLLPSYSTTLASLTSTNQSIDDANSRMDNIEKTKTFLTANKTLVDKVALAVPPDKDTANLITEIGALSLRSAVYVPSIQIVDTATSSVTVSFVASGTYTALIGFVKSIETDLRYMNIKSMALSYAGGTATLSLQVETYKQTATAATEVTP